MPRDLNLTNDGLVREVRQVGELEMPRIDARKAVAAAAEVTLPVMGHPGLPTLEIIGPDRSVQRPLDEGPTQISVRIEELVDGDSPDSRVVVYVRFLDAEGRGGPAWRAVWTFQPPDHGEPDPVEPITLAIPGSLTSGGADTVYPGAEVTRFGTVFAGAEVPGSYEEVMQISTDEGATFAPAPWWTEGPEVPGAWVRPFARVLSAATGEWVEYVGPWLRSAPLPSAEALGAEDVEIIDSVIRPAGGATFSPRVSFSGLEGKTVDAIEWTTSANLGEVANPVEHVGSGVHVLRSGRDAVPEGEIDISNFTSGDVRLTGRLRFRWRAAPEHPFSPWSEPFDIPLPAAPPSVIGVFGPIVLVVGSPPQQFNVATLFQGAEEFEVSGSDRMTVTADGLMTATAGETTLAATDVTITARNDAGQVSLTFTLSVLAQVDPPVRLMGFPNRSISVGAPAVEIDLRTHFAGVDTFAVSGSADVILFDQFFMRIASGVTPSGPTQVTVTGVNAGGVLIGTFNLAYTAAATVPGVASVIPDMVLQVGGAASTYDASVHFTGATAYAIDGSGRLAIHATTGLITRTPGTTALGETTITVTASNAAGPTTATFKLSVSAFQIELCFVPEATIDNGPQANTRLFSIGVQNYAANTTFSDGGMGISATNNGQAFHAATVVAAAAFSGDPRLWGAAGGGTKTARQVLIDNLKAWGGATDNAPGALMGYNGQYELRAVSMIAISRRMPGIWGAGGALTAAEQERLRLIMLGMFLSACVCASDNFPAGWTKWGKGKERNVRGFNSGWGQAPNYSTTTRLFPPLIAMFLAFDNPLANGQPNFIHAQAVLSGFNSAAAYNRFVARIGPAGKKMRDEAGAIIKDAGGADIVGIGGLRDMCATFAFRHNIYNEANPQLPAALVWNLAEQQRSSSKDIADARVGDGWSRAQIIAALSGKAVWRDRDGFSLAQFDERFRTEMLRNWNNLIQPGLPDVRDPANNAVFLGEAGPAGSGWTGRYGIKFGAATSNRLKACLGSVLPNGQTDKSSWAGIPFANLRGAPAELELSDAGAPTRTPKPPNNRSSYTYALDSGAASVALLVTMLTYGVLDIDTPAWRTVLTQMDRGMFFCSYIHNNGWMSYAKGGLPSNSNVEVNQAWMDGQATRWRSWTGPYTGTTAADRKGLHRMFWRAANGIN